MQTTFVLAVGLLAGAVLLYTRSRDLILPLMVITPILVGFAGARVLLWPDSLPLRMAVEVGYRIILLTASIALFRARRGRWEPSAWLLALCLPLLHLSWPAFTDRIPDASISGCRDRPRPRHVAGRVRTSASAHTQALRCAGPHRQHCSRAQQYGNVVQSAVEELQKLTAFRAAWFRLLEGGQLVATHAVGLSTDFLRDAGFATVSDDIAETSRTSDAASHHPRRRRSPRIEQSA